MGYSVFFKNEALDSVLVGVYASLHDGDPGEHGANELEGGGYQRELVLFDDAVDGEKSANSTPMLNVPSRTTVTHVGFWNSAGEFLSSAEVAEERFNNAGVYTIEQATLDLNGDA